MRYHCSQARALRPIQNNVRKGQSARLPFSETTHLICKFIVWFSLSAVICLRGQRARYQSSPRAQTRSIQHAIQVGPCSTASSLNSPSPGGGSLASHTLVTFESRRAIVVRIPLFGSPLWGTMTNVDPEQTCL